jgi:hypothetical protein
MIRSSEGRAVKPIIKKAVVAAAIQQGIKRARAAREPKKAPVAGRIAKVGALLGAGGGIFYLFRTGRLQALIGQTKGAASGADA